MTDHATPEDEKARIEAMRMTSELKMIEQTIVVLNSGIDFVGRQTCRVDEALAIGEFARYLRDLKSDLKERTKVLKEALKISRDNPIETPKPELVAVPA